MSASPAAADHAHSQPAHARLPSWMRRRIPAGGCRRTVERELSTGRLHTVCEEALCPNRAECFGRGTATFLVLGDTCTRGCRFCNVSQGEPRPVDSDEPERVAAAAESMGLDYVVVTSVTRDDLPDGGASHFARIITELRRRLPSAGVEVLIPDLAGNEAAIDVVLDAGPDVLNHNVETVPRLYPRVRPQADFERSLRVLARAAGRGGMQAKSGMMVGLGESREEVHGTLVRLRDAGCSIVTIGQYLQPNGSRVPVDTYVAPAAFREYELYGRTIGISHVVSGPFVRSSYRAGEAARAGSGKSAAMDDGCCP